MRQITDTTAPGPGIGDVIAASCQLVALPAGVMLGGSIAGFYVKMPSEQLVSAFQHLASGIVLAAVAAELVFQLKDHTSGMELLGIFVGFSLGVAAMLSMEALSDWIGGEEGGAHGHGGGAGEGSRRAVSASLKLTDASHAEDGHGHGLESPSHGLESSGPTAAKYESSAGHAVTPADGDGEASASASPRPTRRISVRLAKTATAAVGKDVILTEKLGAAAHAAPRFPIAFAAVVYIDSSMDGLLVGVAMVTGARTGLIMAIALMVEMGFLGLTFATSLKGQRLGLAIPAMVFGPCVIIIGGVIGALIANALLIIPALFAGILAFATSALLYMVTEELLLEAHSSGEDHTWWVDLMFFVGFLGTLLLAIGT